MKTFLAQNQFYSDVHVPETSGSAAANSCPQPLAAAELVSDGVGAKPILASSPSEAATDSCQEPMAADHIPEIFHWVRKLMKDDHRFHLNEEEFMAAIDEEPLFLRSAV